MNSTKTIQPNEGSLIIIAAQCCICAILIFSCLLYGRFNFQSDSLIYPACLFLVALTIWSFWSWQILTKSLFDPYTLFLVTAVLFNGGQAFLEVFHLNEHGILKGIFSSETILKTLFLVIIGLASFHLGGLLSAATGKVNSPKKQSSEKKPSLSTMQHNCRIVGWSLLTISFFPALLVTKDAILVVLHTGYTALYQQELTTSYSATPNILADFLIPGTLFLLAGSKGRHNSKVISVITIIIYSISRLFLGWRAYAVMPLISLAWLWHCLIRPLPKIFLLGAASLMMFVIFPLIATTRNVAGAERLSIDFLLNSFTSIDNPLLAAISEMGGSMMTIAYTLELVPSVRGFDMGAGYFYALLTLMPNFFWEVHPAIARGTASNWLIWEVDRFTASHGGGLGFSFIAEAYLNFGWFGAPIVLGAIGFLFGKLTLWAIRSGEPAKMAMIASFISFFLFYARDEAVTQIRPLVWYALIPYLGVWPLSLSRSKGLPK